MLNDGQTKSQLSESDLAAIEGKCKEVLDWLERNENAEVEGFDAMKKELELVANPILTKMYKGAAGGGEAKPEEDVNRWGGPEVQEVD